MQNLIKQLDNIESFFGLKLGTEVEDCSFEEIVWIQENFPKNTFITLKIGGVDARNDMRFALKNNINKVLAPMVESLYGFENFIKTILNIEKEMNKTTQKSFNIETIQCFEHLDDILASPYFKEIDSVTIGRSDLSGSMNIASVDDTAINSIIAQVCEKLLPYKKPLSIGGSLTKKSVHFLKEVKYPYLMVNTRNVVVRFNHEKSSEELENMINKMLSFEKDLCSKLMEIFKDKDFLYKDRIEKINNRF